MGVYKERGSSFKFSFSILRPDLKICWFAFIRVCFYEYTRSVGKNFFYHFEMEKIALTLIYNAIVTKIFFFRNEDKKKNDSHVSGRPGRVTANQHIFKSGLINVLFQ